MIDLPDGIICDCSTVVRQIRDSSPVMIHPVGMSSNRFSFIQFLRKLYALLFSATVDLGKQCMEDVTRRNSNPLLLSARGDLDHGGQILLRLNHLR